MINISDFKSAEDAAAFLADENAASKLVKLSKQQLKWILTYMGQTFGSKASKVSLVQLANAAILNASLSTLEEDELGDNVDDGGESSGDEVGESVDEGAVVSVIEGGSAVSESVKPKTVSQVPLSKDEQFIDDAAARVELLKLKIEWEREKMQLEKEAERERMQLEREAERERMQLEREVEREKMHIEREVERERARERELERERQREKENHELEMARLKSQRADRSDESNFKISEALPLVPECNEGLITDFFNAFERVAETMSWPTGYWSLLVQRRLRGKGLKAYNTLSLEDSNDYEKVKLAVLRAYELVPEAYRQRFRQLTKDPRQTFAEFASLKKEYFCRWLEATKANDVTSIKEIILLEDFKNYVSRELRLHLEEMKVKSLYEAAQISDEYVLTHKTSGLNYKPIHFNKTSSTSYFKSNAKVQKSSGQNKSSSYLANISCYACGEKGHLSAKCPKKSVNKKSVTFVSSSSVEMSLSEVPEIFRNHVRKIHVSDPANPDETWPVVALRDTGSAQTMILREALPKGFKVQGREFILLCGYPDGMSTSPLEVLKLTLPHGNILGPLAIVDKLPIAGVQCIVGNDFDKGIVSGWPIMVSSPPAEAEVAVLTRAQVKNRVDHDSLENLFSNNSNEVRQEMKLVNSPDIDFSRGNLIKQQSQDPSLEQFRQELLDNIPEEITKPCVFLKDRVMYRRSRNKQEPASEGNFLDQIIVPSTFRHEILKRSHDDFFSGHMGIYKTMKRVSKNFFWPHMKQDISRYIKGCKECQKIGRPNQPIPKAPLQPIPICPEPFSEIIIDIVGPLPRTKSGNQYLLTMIDRMSRYPEAIPVRSIHTPVILKHLLNFFTKVGLPKVVQSDRGSNFTSRLFRTRMKEWCIKHTTSTPYHPESQGALERFHQTFKTILTKYCSDNPVRWDDFVPYVLYAIRSAPSETLGLSPFQIVFGHSIRGPLEVLREVWEEDPQQEDFLHNLSTTYENLHQAWQLVTKNMEKSQRSMKETYDRKSVKRSFNIGDKVLILLPVVGQLKAKYQGPYKIVGKKGDLTYIVETPDRRKSHTSCHINMLKLFCEQQSPVMVTKVHRDESKREECRKSFTRIKAVLTSYPILQSPDFDKPFKMATDASDIGVGAVLIQEDSTGTDHPVAFFSRKLNQAQKRYSTIEKEALGLLLAYEHFEVYLSSCKVPIKIFTDHNPITFINKFKNKNKRLTRWSLYFQDKNIEIHHVKGKQNVVPDVLSRIPVV